jgi:phage-related protein
MATLLYTSKLRYGSPTRNSSFKVEKFQTDSYSIRAAVGINPMQTEYDLEWTGLTSSEMTALVAQFESAKGFIALDWTPPGESNPQKFTVDNFDVQEYPGPTVRYSVRGKLTRVYDL